MTAPKWFTEDLKRIDPRFYPSWNEYYGYWEIKIRADLDLKETNLRDPNMILHYAAKNPTIAVEKHLTEQLLEDLRRRKYLKMKYGAGRDEFAEMQKRNKEAKAKASALGIELMAEGFIKLDQIANQRLQRYDMHVEKEASA